MQNYFSVLDNESGTTDEKLSSVASLFKDGLSDTLHLDIFDDKDADVIRKGLKDTTTISYLNIVNFIPVEIMKAISEGLKQNNSVLSIYYKEIYDEQPGDSLPKKSLRFLREIFAIPRISYQIKLKSNSSVLQIINGESAKYIKNLNVTVGSAQLDELLDGLCDNKFISDMYIIRYEDDLKCHNLSLFGNFEFLVNLKIQIHSDESEFFTALKSIGLLRTMNLSNSTITADNARNLADLITKTTSLTCLDLRNCNIDNEAFSSICQGLLKNKTITELELQNNPFDRLDLVDQTLTKIKKLAYLATNAFDSNMANIFDIKSLALMDNHFDGLKDAKIQRLTLKTFADVQQVTNLFTVLTYSRHIHSLTIYECENEDVLFEFCKHLAVNKTLKRVDTMYMKLGEKSFKMLCHLIKTNNTLESLSHHGPFPKSEEYSLTPHGPLFQALKNTSLTIVEFNQLQWEDRDVEELLKANPYVTFSKLADSIGSRGGELNAKNKRNIDRRLRDIKCNVMTLARSYLSSLIPFKLWQLILEHVRPSDVDLIDLFKQSLRNKLTQMIH